MADKTLSGDPEELNRARALRLEADRKAPMSERLARMHYLCKQMSALKGAPRTRLAPSFGRVGSGWHGGRYGVPPANFTYEYQEGLGWKPGPKRPEPSQKLQAPGWSSIENQ